MENEQKSAFFALFAAAPLGAQIQALRILKGYDLDKLAEYSGVSTSTISRVENGKDITVSRFIDILRGLEFPFYEVISTYAASPTCSAPSSTEVKPATAGVGYQFRPGTISHTDQG